MARNDKGFTLMELLVVIGILAILAIIIFLILNPMTQIRKAHDGKRKADLARLNTVFEDYYNDHNCYPNDPSELVPDYISELPTDPNPSQSYAYSRPDCDTYRIYAKLEYEQDPAIAEVGCESGCGPDAGSPGGICTYNYGASSPNVELENCSTCSLSCQQVGRCDDLIKENYDCLRWFCNWDECSEECQKRNYLCTYIGGG